MAYRIEGGLSVPDRMDVDLAINLPIWTTGKQYIINDFFSNNNDLYLVTTTHTSSTIVGDVGNLKRFNNDNRIFIDNTTTAPAITGIPSLVEINNANTVLGGSKNVILFYTGTDIVSDVPTHVYHIDEGGTLTLLQEPIGKEYHVVRVDSITGVSPTAGEVSALINDTAKVFLVNKTIEFWSYNVAWTLDKTYTPGKTRIFADNTSVSPVLIKKPTLAEITTFVGTNTDVLIFYTGTDISTDIVIRVYDVDNVGNVTLTYSKPFTYSVHSDVYYQNTGLTSVVIDQMSISPLSGNYRADFNTQYNTQLANISQQGVLDLNTLSSTINGVGTPAAFALTPSYAPGVYETASAITFTGAFTLDGGGATDPIFIFRSTAGALTFSASCTFSLINGATANNVFFQAPGAVTVGASSSISGTIIGAGAVTHNTNSTLVGRSFTTNGLVTNTGGNVSVPALESPYPLGVLENFIFFASSGNLTDNNAGVLLGDVGTNNGTITGFTSLSGIVYQDTQGSSIVSISICVDGIVQQYSTRERIDSILKEDVITLADISLTDGQVVTAQVINSIGISRFYNRSLILTEIN
jgi:hypothetical protein